MAVVFPGISGCVGHRVRGRDGFENHRVCIWNPGRINGDLVGVDVLYG